MTALRHLPVEAASRRFAVTWLIGAGAAVSAVGLVATSAYLISAAALQPPIIELSMAIAAVRAFAIGRAGLRYVERLAGHDATLRALAGLRVGFYRRLVPLAPAGLPAFRRGDLLTRLVADVDTLQDLPLRVLPPLASVLAVGVASVVLVGVLHAPAAVALLATLLVALLAAPALTAWAGRRADARAAAARADLGARVAELVRAQPDLIAFGAVDAYLDRLRDRDAEISAIARRTATAAGLGAGLTVLCGGAAVWAALALGATGVREGALDGVALAVVVLVPLAVFEAVQQVPAALAVYHRVRRSGGRLLDVTTAAVPVAELGEVAEPGEHTATPADAAIRLRGVRARWPSGGADAPAAVDGLDLDLPPGRRIAVVGASGAGKTTLAAVLLRFVDLDAGEYTLGGIDVRRLPGDEVRAVVKLCPQDPHVFDSTVRENLRLARPDSDDETLTDALDRSRLLDWVKGLPDGLDTFVGERGTRMAGGERQRLALARALLADPPVLVLDEPAANLDVPTADALIRDLLDATTGRSTLLITHRLAGLEKVDEIVVLDAGRVVERGAHDTLLGSDGAFRRLWEHENAVTELRRGPSYQVG